MIFMIMGVPSEGLNCFFLNSGSNSATKKEQEDGSVDLGHYCGG
jgi:hypothetical protein